MYFCAATDQLAKRPTSSYFSGSLSRKGFREVRRRYLNTSDFSDQELNTASGGVTDNLTCSLCLGQFNNPKFLQCYHSFCERCLTALVQNSARRTQVICPECRQVTQLPPGGVSQLQTNLYLTRLLDANADRDPEMCQVHRNEKLRYYCVDCDIPICLDCRMTKHAKHDAEDLDKAVAAAKRDLKTEKSRLADASRELSDYLALLEKKETAAEKDRQSVERKLRERAATVNRWVADALDKGLQSLQDASEEIRGPIRQYKSDTTSRLNSLQAMGADLERVLTDSSCSNQEVISLRREMTRDQGSEERLCRIPCTRLSAQYDGECLNSEAIAKFIGTGRAADFFQLVFAATVAPLKRLFETT
ncbi:hypothetical protein BaRGS_00022255 [Batillaria attramentaria]|uniref:Uncharacterized protein n=1 Tax=Batillaria attramentaria TaxID=370345 RepID=A0ABD0KH23_9CAEN